MIIGYTTGVFDLFHIGHLNIIKQSIKKYYGSYIIVYNEDEKRNIVNSGIIEEDKVFVVGCPRVDYSFNINKLEKKESNKVTLVYYCIQTGGSLPIYEGQFRTEGIHKIDPFNWSKLAQQTETALSEYEKKNRNKIKVIFKTKTGNLDQSIRIKKLDLGNINVIHNNTGHHLLEKADMVVAFNSTIIFETIAAGIPVIVPMLNLNENEKKFVFNLSNVDNVFCANNVDEFFKYINTIYADPKRFQIKNTKSQNSALKKFVGNYDGKSGLRFRKLIEEINV